MNYGSAGEAVWGLAIAVEAKLAVGEKGKRRRIKSNEASMKTFFQPLTDLHYVRERLRIGGAEILIDGGVTCLSSVPRPYLRF